MTWQKVFNGEPRRFTKAEIARAKDWNQCPMAELHPNVAIEYRSKAWLHGNRFYGYVMNQLWDYAKDLFERMKTAEYE